MPSSPDGAPMGYSIWGYLEQLNRTHINSLGELYKNLLRHWRKMSEPISIKYWLPAKKEF